MKLMKSLGNLCLFVLFMWKFQGPFFYYFGLQIQEKQTTRSEALEKKEGNSTQIC